MTSAVTLLRKPIGIIAAVLGLVQSTAWLVLTILGVLLYNCSLDLPFDVTNIKSSQMFLGLLSTMYFYSPECQTIPVTVPVLANIIPPEEVQIWVIINLAFNFLWMAASIFYLTDVFRADRPLVSCYVWISVTSCVVILDLATTIAFGLDFGTLVKSLDDLTTPILNAPAILTVPAFMMSLAARGYVLWLINDLLVIFLITSILTERRDSKANTRDLSRQGSFTNPTMNHLWPDSTEDTYHRPTQASRNAWDPSSPTGPPMYPYSGQQPMTPPAQTPRGYSSPLPIPLHDPPKGRVEPQRHIPSPDYSPTMNHRPMLPLRPALRKPPGNVGQIGSTVF